MLCKHKQNELVCPDCEAEAFANGVVSRNGDKFLYNNYWGRWSRVLVPMGLHSSQVEVDLTAINPMSDELWPRVAAIHIRRHGTSMDRKDKLSATLPTYAYEMMQSRIKDEAILCRLLHEDLIPLIDWDKFNKINNGGASLADCLKVAA